MGLFLHPEEQNPEIFAIPHLGGLAGTGRDLEGTKEEFYPNTAKQDNSSYKQILTII